MQLQNTKFWKKRIFPLCEMHHRICDRAWLKPIGSRPYVLIIILATIIAAIANYGVRQHQLSVWKDNPGYFYLGDMPLFSTTDASFYLAQAKTLEKNESNASYHAKRLFPNQITIDEKADRETHRDVPLLSVIISALSPSEDRRDILNTAHAMLPITGALTALAIIFALGITGYWLEATVAAIGGGLSAAYLIRSSVGRIDTDQLNLGFFYLLMGLVILAGRTISLRVAMSLTVLAALVGQLFLWWYNNNQEFLIAAFIALLWVDFISHLKWKRTLLLGATFFVLSGVSFQITGGAYVLDVLSYEALIFPNTFETITELKIIPLNQILQSAIGNVSLGVFCIIGLALWAMRHPVLAVAYGPIAAFGLLNFIIGNRAVFYSAPILWFGGAWLATTLARGAFYAFPNRYRIPQNRANIIITTIIASCFGAIAWTLSPTNYVPRPSFPTQMMAAFQSLETRADADNSVVATWWDYGYASILLNNLPVLHDPGSQTQPVTHLVARSLLETDQRDTVAMLRYLARDGLDGISRDGSSKAALYDAARSRTNLPTKDIYLVLTEQMGQWMGSISKLGNWDIDAGRPLRLQGNATGAVVGYQDMNCSSLPSENMLDCNGYEFNLRNGEIDGKPGLGGVAIIRDGKLTGATRFNGRQKSFLQLHYTGNSNRAVLIHDSLYDSSFNQLFHRGQSYEGGFELVYDDYPHARIYKLRGATN